jgi:hypothetical protein
MRTYIKPKSSILKFLGGNIAKTQNGLVRSRCVDICLSATAKPMVYTVCDISVSPSLHLYCDEHTMGVYGL